MLAATSSKVIIHVKVSILIHKVCYSVLREGLLLAPFLAVVVFGRTSIVLISVLMNIVLLLLMGMVICLLILTLLFGGK